MDARIQIRIPHDIRTGSAKTDASMLGTENLKLGTDYLGLGTGYSDSDLSSEYADADPGTWYLKPNLGTRCMVPSEPVSLTSDSQFHQDFVLPNPNLSFIDIEFIFSKIICRTVTDQN